MMTIGDYMSYIPMGLYDTVHEHGKITLHMSRLVKCIVLDIQKTEAGEINTDMFMLVTRVRVYRVTGDVSMWSLLLT
jgi:hypothetical protein